MFRGTKPRSPRGSACANVETTGGQALPVNAAPWPLAKLHSHLIGGQVDQHGCVPRPEKPKRPLRPVGIQALERSIEKSPASGRGRFTRPRPEEAGPKQDSRSACTRFVTCLLATTTGKVDS